MNIAFVHNAFPAGGAERITIDLIEYFSKSEGKYNIYVLAHKIQSELIEKNWPYHVNIILLPNFAQSEDLKQAIHEIVKTEHIDIIVFASLHIAGISEIKRQSNCKIIYANHGMPLWEKEHIFNSKAEQSRRKTRYRIMWNIFRKYKYGIFGKAKRLAVKINRENYDESDAFTVLCKEYKSDMIKYLGLDPHNNRIRVIENPEYPVPNINFHKKKQILYVGRLSYFDKRVDRLLDIWKMAEDRLPDWEMLIVGDGEERNNLERMASRLNLKRIRFEGQKTDVREYYREASILCLVSETEGWPLCLTEAQANGVIPVAFSCSGGVRQILSPSGQNGFLVKPFNKRQFAETLIKIAKDITEEKIMEIRKNAVSKSSEYSIDIIGSKWEELFDSLL